MNDRSIQHYYSIAREDPGQIVTRLSDLRVSKSTPGDESETISLLGY